MSDTVALSALDHAALKRLAVQLAPQLPCDHAAALAVIAYLRDIADWEAGLVRPERVLPSDTGAVLPFARPA